MILIFSRFEPEGAYKKNAYKNMRKGYNGGKKQEQAGAVLGQAQLKLGMDFTSINLHSINEK